MTDTIEQKESETPEPDAFDRALAQQEPGSIPWEEAPQVEESALEAETILDPAPEVDQDSSPGDPPSDVSPKDLAKAIDDIHRAGLSALVKGKSDSYLLELGRECDTNKRQRDRESTERQNQERDASGQSLGEAASSDSASPDGDGGTAVEDPPAEPSIDLTPLAEEFGEDVARPLADLVSSLDALKRDNADLRKTLNDQETARQRAPVEEATAKALDGMTAYADDLSKPEARAALVKTADALVDANRAKYEALPLEEQAAAALQDAALVHFGVRAKPEPPAERRIAKPPGSSSNQTPEAKLGAFDRAVAKQKADGKLKSWR